jgi:hypothetical protein
MCCAQITHLITFDLVVDCSAPVPLFQMKTAMLTFFGLIVGLASAFTPIGLHASRIATNPRQRASDVALAFGMSRKAADQWLSLDECLVEALDPAARDECVSPMDTEVVGEEMSLEDTFKSFMPIGALGALIVVALQFLPLINGDQV